MINPADIKAIHAEPDLGKKYALILGVIVPLVKIPPSKIV